MNDDNWQELDRLERERPAEQALQIKVNRIRDLETSVDYLTGVNDDLLKENYALQQKLDGSGPKADPGLAEKHVLLGKLLTLRDELKGLSEGLVQLRDAKRREESK